MNRTVFISFGYGNQSAAFPAIDPLMMQASLNQIASMVMGYGYHMVMRDHPTVTSMMDVHFESAQQQLNVVPGDAPLEKIVNDYQPCLAFLLGGEDQIVTDAAGIASTRPDIILLPLRHTGGAAKLVAEGMEMDGTAHSLTRQYGAQSMGLTLICKAISSLNNRPRTPGMHP